MFRSEWISGNMHIYRACALQTTAVMMITATWPVLQHIKLTICQTVTKIWSVQNTDRKFLNFLEIFAKFAVGNFLTFCAVNQMIHICIQ